MSRDSLVAARVARHGGTAEEAEERLDTLIAFHPFSLPEALWREGYCRPFESREAARAVSS